MGASIMIFRSLAVYRLAYTTAMEIFNLTKEFPKEEKYSLTDQIRRSSRSVCSNIAEGWYKRKYVAMFICKLTDSISEAAETQSWLQFSFGCNYLSEAHYLRLLEQYEHIIAQLLTMQKKSETFCKG